MVRDTDWAEFFKRYMHDHPTFRDSLRKWIVATNADQATQDATLADHETTLADHETRIDVLETATGDPWDLGSVTTATDGIFDFGSLA